MGQTRLLAEQQTAEGSVVLALTGEIDVTTIGVLAEALARLRASHSWWWPT